MRGLISPRGVRRGPTKKCDRCGLSHVKSHHDQCPHCADLGETELDALKARLALESKGHTSLGRAMIACAALLVLFVVLLSFSQ